MRISALIIFLIVTTTACQRNNDETLVINGLTMGTTYSIKIQINNTNKVNIRDDIEEILSEINQSMSNYIKESELSIINLSKISDWQSVSDNLFAVINHAKTY